jgi:CheY-like chemotaxis protein
MKSDSPIYVLVVEDEFLSRLHAVNLVEDAGYKAIEASNSEEAIAILEARKDIRIVFTDVDMPGTMDGLKLAHAIRTRWPPVELIVTSGHFNLSDADMPERGRFFPKPIVIKRSFRPYTILSLRLPAGSTGTNRSR